MQSFSEAQLEKQYAYFIGYNSLMKQYESRGIDIYYYVDGLGQYLVMQVVKQDLSLTIITLSLIALFVLLFTGLSPWLTMWTLFILIGNI